jgi:mRNA interferase RelE/StbE
LKRIMSRNRYQIEYGVTALNDLEELPSKQRAQILRKIDRLQQGLHGDIKRLRDADFAYRLRMGDYRVLFDVEGSVIVIRRIGHRKNIYE